MRVLRGPQALDAAHLTTLAALREGEAAVDGAAVDVHGAGPAGPGVADALGAEQAERVAEEIEERGVAVGIYRDRPTVE